MRLILEIWGERAELSEAEIRAILKGENVDYEIISIDYPVIVADIGNYEALERAGLLRSISKHLYSGRNLPKMELELDEYAIRVRRKNKNLGPREIERELAKGIKGTVNLTNPKNVIRVFLGEEIHIGLELLRFDSREFEERKSKNLPISYPITMHPRLARFMVNLARIPRGAKVLDPFCGTGSILIEAGLMGMEIYGSDIDERMLNATEINLRKFGLKATLKRQDVGDVCGQYDAIITDPPYGRSSSTLGENVYALYERAFKKFSEITNKVVISLPDKRALKIGEEYFTLDEVYPLRVHKSLTRYFSYFHI